VQRVWRLGARPTKTRRCAAHGETAATRRERAATSSGRNMKQKTLTRAAGRDGARREAVHHRREAHGSRVRVKATGASALRRVGCPSRASSRRGRRRPGARRLRDRLSESWERRRSRHGRAVQRRRRRFAPRRRVPVAAVVVVASDAGSLPMPLWTSQHCRGRGLAHTRPTVFLLPVSLLRVAVSPRTFFSQALRDARRRRPRPRRCRSRSPRNSNNPCGNQPVRRVHPTILHQVISR